MNDEHRDERFPEGADRVDQREHPAQPEQTDHGFAEGIEQKPDSPEEDEVGRFSTGIEQTPEESPQKEHIGRFSEGIEQTPETPEKAHEGRFSEGVEQRPDHS